MNNSGTQLNLNSNSTTLNTLSTMSHSISHSTKTLLTPSNFKRTISSSAESQELFQLQRFPLPILLFLRLKI